MSRYLFAAEADKIQDLIFRSARLREVVGASQLLTRFCRQVPCILGVSEDDIIVSDAGSFRILFDTEEAVQRFGEHLAEVYRLATGGSLTIADPVPVTKGFQEANQAADKNLRQAKRWQGRELSHFRGLSEPSVLEETGARRGGWQSQEQAPYMALCSSCGTGLAVTLWSYYSGEVPQYQCRSCLNKGLERPFDEPGVFLSKFYREVAGDDSLEQYQWPGQAVREDIGEKDPLEDIAQYDSRRYVAYLVADGNRMGEVFGACASPEQMQKLSLHLEKVILRALAEPTGILTESNPRDGLPNFIPVLPLILGGDDVFAVIPAPWALDFARRFARAYEKEMAEMLDSIDLEEVPRPTVSVAVVVAKSKHPYHLAYQTGLKRLEEAKRLSRQFLLKGNQENSVSALSFEIAVGGRLDSQQQTSNGNSPKFRSTLRPYFLMGDELGQEVPDLSRTPAWGLSPHHLIEQRMKLSSIPGKRLAELQELYDREQIPKSLKPDDMGPWQERLERLLGRIGRNPRHADLVRQALQALGSHKSCYWLEVGRIPESPWRGHGMPDLLEAWDFALDLSVPRREYEEGS